MRFWSSPYVVMLFYLILCPPFFYYLIWRFEYGFYLTLILSSLSEELLKAYFAIKFRNIVFRLILIFGSIELSLKMIILLNLSFNEFVIYMLFALISLLFHISTAYNYSSKFFQRNIIANVIALSLIHILFNMISEFTQNDTLSFFQNILIALLPLLWLVSISRYNLR